LIVDDSPHRAGLQAALVALDASLEVNVAGEAADGLQAIRQVEQLSPDVVVMDVRMPGMDGIQATRLIKRRWPEVCVVVLTLYDDYRAEALQAGADAFLLKGCPFDDLLDCLRQAKAPAADESGA
jgi:DNA-binding NarL/FixJ family response regulator